MTRAGTGLADRLRAGRTRRVVALPLLAAGTGLIALAALSTGAVPVPSGRVLAVLAGRGDPADALVLLQVRLPRLVAGLLVGAALAVSGALMQSLFRNPLADPGLIGVSAGASLAAGLTIVLGDALLAPWLGALPVWALPAGAFAGGLATTALLYAIATRHGATAVGTLLLAGVGLEALAGALMGILAYASDDRQLRDLTFWLLGSLGGATWTKVLAIAPLVMAALAAVPALARGLNALSLGEAEAFYLGFRVERLKRATILLVAAAVGAAVATAGPIGFVGIIVPHALRLTIGPDHRLLLPGAALLGGALLVGADTLARTLVAPAELPIGVVTACIGAPFFLAQVLRSPGRIAA